MQLCAPAPAALVLYNTVEVGHGGIALGVEDRVHVLGAADNAQLCYRFVRADNELHPWPHAVHEALAAVRVACATGAEDRPPLGKVDFAVEAKKRCAGTAPGHGSLASRCVVLKDVADRVVLPAKDGPLVIADRVGAHHPHPRHWQAPSPVNREVNRTFTTERCNRVPNDFVFLLDGVKAVKQFLVTGQ
jgi:hypothetical protein